MDFYAKSGGWRLSKQRERELEQRLKDISANVDAELEDWEKQAIQNGLSRMRQRVRTDGDQWKTLRDHLEETVKCAENFFAEYGGYFTEREKRLILEACRIHDIGKLNLLFQAKVNPQIREKLSGEQRKEKEVPHGFLSAISRSKDEFKAKFSDLDLKEKDFQIFITAVYYHHDREDEWTTQEIKEYAQKYYQEYLKEYTGEEDVKIRPSYRKKLLFQNSSTWVPQSVCPEVWNFYMLLKGMLNRFDYTVSAGYEKAEQNPDLEKKVLVHQIETCFSDCGLRPVQKYMRECRDKNLVVIAPTGMGKTEAALLWLDGEKGFYTLPLKVSSNAIYERILKKYQYEDVALLHSDSIQRYLEEGAEKDEGAYGKYQKAKLLSAPLTVCTVDQLFKFVYKALGTEIFAATLKYSKVILDEIQSYEPRVIATLIYGLKTITDMGGKFAIMTATFPPVLKHFMERYGLMEGTQYELGNFSSSAENVRHQAAVFQSEMNAEEIVKQGNGRKVLVICNTVGKAQEMYRQLCELSDQVFLLHSRFIRKHRRQLEKSIMDFSENKNAEGIWVTTQIVEASLDIDFDLLYTEMCTADSLLQRMGRCNRKGRYVPKAANILIFANGNGVGKKSVYDPFLYDRSLKKLSDFSGIPFSEEKKAEYIAQVYCAEELEESSYYGEIEKYLDYLSGLKPLEYNKREAEQKFRDIHSVTVTPDIVYEQHRDIFESSQEIFSETQMDRDIKNVFLSKVNDLTLALNCYYGKFPEGVDHAAIGSGNKNMPLKIHRANLKYEFDEICGKGQGLLLNKPEDEILLA